MVSFDRFFLVASFCLLASVAASAVSNNRDWDDRFNPPGIVGVVNAVAVSGTNVYVGGDFTILGKTNFNHIAHWDGRQWSPLDDGLNAQVYALAVQGNDVFAGGSFTANSETNLNHIARWDGTKWYPVGNGVSSDVLAIA